MPETLPPAVPPPELRLDSEHPWPGLISFTEADHAFFFGREREVAELARAIRQKTVTVFFGKSGLGKSSILRAGVAPLLRESEFVSIYIRLNHDEAAPPLQDQVEIAIERVVTAEKIEAPKLVRSETLWEHFHKKECDWWDSDNRLVKPVLVFDQFEELLTLGQSTPERAVRTAAFLSELEDLVENRPPTALAQRFEAERGLARNYDLERLDYRVVLTLREDFLPDLEGLREQLRAIMFNRVRLLPMSGEQAMEVILKPGGHLVDEDVAVRIVDFVSSSERSRLQSAVTRAQIAKRAIEPALLSVILQELNNRRIQAGQNKITTDLVGNAQAAEIFQDFYRRGLQGLGEPVREFIEDWLLTSSGARNRIAEEDALTKPGISEPVLATLIDRRIVQRETTGRIKWLELTHDTLADVVRADRAEHQQHRQLELAAAREAETRKKLRRVQKLAMAFAVLLVVALLLFLYASNQKRAAQKAQNFTIRTTDRLANGMLQKIQQTSRIRIAEKQDLAGQLINIVQQLRGEAPEELSIRLADLLATTSLMFFDAGRDDEAATYAKQAESLVASAQARSGNDSVALARVQLASALTLRRNWQLEKALGKFEQAQARLKDAFSHGLEEPLSGSVLQARLSSAYSLALNADNRAEEAEKIIAGSISEIEKTLARPANKDPSIRYDLTRELLRLKTARFDNARFAGNVEAMNASYAAAEEALRKAKADFPSTVDRFWNYFDAKNRDMEAYIAQRQDLYDQALAKMGAAIAELHQLLSDDPQNMFWRFELGNALCHRAEIAKAVAGSVVGLDKDAAEKLADTDREAARKLAITLRRDQHSRWLCFWLARLVDYEDDAPSAAASYLTRIDLEERKSGSRVELREEKVFAHAACLKAYLKRKDFRLAIREAEAALAEVDLLDTNNRKEPARRQAMRVEILEELLRVPAEDLGRSAWSGAYDTVITDLKEWAASGLNPADQASSERYVNSELADQYLRDTKFSDAIGIYQKLAADTLNTINAGQNQRLELQNYLYYRRKIVECQTALGQWSAVPGVCRDTREHLVALVEKQPALTSVLPYVQSLVSSMEAAHKSLKEKVSSLDAETASVFKTLSSELEAMQESARKYSDAHKTVPRSPRIDFEKALTNFRTGEAENYWLVRQPLGWADAPVYPGNWRTLTGPEFDSTAALVTSTNVVSEEQIQRIRICALDFYEHGQLIEAEYVDPRGDLYTVAILSAGAGTTKHLDGSSRPIHEANAAAPLQLRTAEDAAAYIRFFCAYVRGPFGAFQIVENNMDIPWATTAPSNLKKDVGRLLRPLAVWPDPEAKGNWSARATVQYSDALFHVLFKIDKGGTPAMRQDEPVASNMPLNLSVFKSGDRSSDKLETLDLDMVNAPGGSNEVEALLSAAESTQKRLDLAEEATLLQAGINSMFPSEESGETLQNVLRKAAKIYAGTGRYPEAIGWQRQMVDLQNKALTALKTGDKQYAAAKETYLSGLTGLAWYQLLAKDFAGALASTEEGRKVDESHLLLETNHAHALLFLKRSEEAEKIYRKYIGQIVRDTSTWEQVILEDFAKFEKEGLPNAEFDRIRAVLKAAQ